MERLHGKKMHAFGTGKSMKNRPDLKKHDLVSALFYAERKKEYGIVISDLFDMGFTGTKDFVNVAWQDGKVSTDSCEYLTLESRLDV